MLTGGSYVLVSVHIKGTTQHGAHPSHKGGDDNRCHINVWLNHQRKYLSICCLNRMARTKFLPESSAEIVHQQTTTRLVIKDIVTIIRDNAFEDFEVLKELKLCDGLRQIGNYSFKGCVTLEKIEINSNLESICSSAFEGCIGATELIIPRGNLKSIRCH